MVFLRWFQISLLLLRIVAPDIILQSFFWLRRSQFRRPSLGQMNASEETCSVNPRVGFHSTLNPRAAAFSVAAKNIGGKSSNSITHSDSRKRAFRRARRRAELRGGTEYRGRWFTAQELGTEARPLALSGNVAASRAGPAKQPWQARPRLRIRSFNAGGISAEVYDNLHHWLLHRARDDIIILQEIRWGLGRGEGSWSIPGWTFVVSADPKNRYCGVCVIVSDKVATQDRLTYQVCIPGRLLHVRCFGDRATLDVAACYQWVWQNQGSEKIAESRSLFWQKLGSLLQGIPQRNLVLIGADFNTRCSPISGLVGRGVLRSDTPRDTEFEAMLQTNDIVLLNTWSSSKPRICHTFHNGSACSQIDFLGMRRPTADATARRSLPRQFELAPWRRGPRHHALIASIPWRAGWAFGKRRPGESMQFSLRNMRVSLKQQDSNAQQLESGMRAILSQATSKSTVGQISQQVWKLCAQLYPRSPTKLSNKPSCFPAVTQAVEQLWLATDAKRRRLPARSIRDAIDARRKAEAFKAASKALRQASRAARREWFEGHIAAAEHAALRHDLGEVYRVINILAPKKRCDLVRIKNADGALLQPKDEFAEIFGYFKQVFSRRDAFEMPRHSLEPISYHEILAAVRKLKGGKAVPPGSVPADGGVCCPRLNPTPDPGCAYTAEATDCTLSLLPKPQKTSRRPADLRPLGLQDACSKVLAHTIRVKLQEHTLAFLKSKPQYAYIPERAIDEAIARVSQHCRAIRDALSSSVLSVQARRAGQQQARCLGGAMLGIDLSRAFDSITRVALQRSLQHAGAPEPLQQAVLQLHEHCRYRVRHKGNTGSFAMEVGVRQGCVLSPYLYALFSCLIYDEIAARTSHSWASASMTLFADDSHLSWVINDVSDLQFMMRSIQVTFEVFRAYGMEVHPEKSHLVIHLRGSAGARWLKKHLQRTETGCCIEVGTPHQPIRIPKVRTMLYLGIVASYTKFEYQTCRLAKVLHNRQLTMQQRLRMYVSCVRSSLLYGAHATGISPAVARKHEQFDSRAIRATAHLTKESTAQLRARLQLDSPLTVLGRTLERRQQRVESADCRAWFGRLRSEVGVLQNNPHIGASAGATEHILCERLQYPCPDCGIYFSTLRHMRSHRAKQHAYKGQNVRPQPGVLSAASYAQGSVQGMPECRWCGKQFTRVEGLKQHLKSGCDFDVKPPTVKAETITAVEEQVPSQRAESPRGRAPLVVSADASNASACPFAAPLDNEQFCSSVKANWSQTAAQPDVKRRLREHCLICGQWGSRLKQHIRLMHADFWKHRSAADSMCRRAGLDAADPCSYCGVASQNPRRHNLSCIVLFQAALAKAHLDNVSPSGADGGPIRGCRPRSPGESGAGFGLQCEDVGEATSRENGRGWGLRASPQVAPGREQRQRSILQFLGRMGQAPLGSGSCQGEAEPGGGESADPGTHPLPGEDVGTARARTHEDPPGRGVHSILRYFGARVHGNASRSCPELSELFTQGKVKSALQTVLALAMMRDMRERAEQTLHDEEKLQRCFNVGWARMGETALDPVWVYHTWNAQEKKQEVADVHPLKHTEALKLLDLLIEHLPRDGVLTKFGSTKRLDLMKEFKTEVVPIMLQLGLRGQSSQQCYDALKTLSGCSIMKLQGVRWRPERAHKPPLAKALEDAYLATSFCDWAPRSQQDTWARRSA